MASTMQYYTITITNSTQNTAVAPNNGFVDHQRVENYYASTPYAFETTPSGLTLALCQAKRRGNVRYQEIIRQIELVQNVWFDPNTISAPGGSGISEPSSFQFQLVGHDYAFVTPDELVAGATLISTACIQRCIARALTATMNREIDVFDPTSATTIGNTAAVPRYGSRIYVASSFQIGSYMSTIANANAVISVSLLNA